MICKICGDNDVKVIYNSYIRDGKVCNDTNEKVPIYKCGNCNVFWHEKVRRDYAKYYESAEYREELEDTALIEDFYKLHDSETLDKFQYTGTGIYRDKVVADVGCGGGAFLDFLKGVAGITIGIEPSEYYRKEMKARGHKVYPYTIEAVKEYEGKIDVITSFDVIEHVEDPVGFLTDIYRLLSQDGCAVIGTPTDAPVMRQLVGKDFDNRLLFSMQHLWIFGEKNLLMMAHKAGFADAKIEFKQRYGIGNLITWLQTRMPKGHVMNDVLSDTLDAVWKSECCEHKISDYVVLYLRKAGQR